MSPKKMPESKILTITLVGKDQIGIIATVSSCLAEKNINIVNISQTIMQDFFTMNMTIDMSKSHVERKQLEHILTQIGDEMNLEIHIQEEPTV